MSNHEFNTSGNDTGKPKMMALCKCGWSGPVLDGQGLESQAEAKKQWEDHLLNSTKDEE